MQQIYPTLRPCETSEVYRDVLLQRDAPRVLLNVVTSVDGVSSLPDGSSGIGSRTDRQLMRQLRVAADAVVTGAGTLRLERISPGVSQRQARERQRAGLRPQPLSVVMVGKDPLHFPEKLGQLDKEELLVFLPSGSDVTALEQKATIYLSSSRLPDPLEVVRILRDNHGVRVLLVEGGPTLFTAFLQKGLINEVFWTVAPKLLLSAGPGMLRGATWMQKPLDLQLISVYEHDGELYTRYMVQNSAPHL